MPRRQVTEGKVRSVARSTGFLTGSGELLRENCILYCGYLATLGEEGLWGKGSEDTSYIYQIYA